MEDEIQLEFRRFSSEKQEQIRQLVAYTTLMGLSGKDLVSIGGKLDRIQKRKEHESNLQIGLSYNVVPVGKSASEREKNKNAKWYWTDGNGVKWRFERDYGHSVNVMNCKTNKTKRFYFDFAVSGRSSFVPNVMYHVHTGTITLNF